MSLTPEIDAFIAGRVASGRFRSASEVVRAALRLLELDERQKQASRYRHPIEGRQTGASGSAGDNTLTGGNELPPRSGL